MDRRRFLGATLALAISQLQWPLAIDAEKEYAFAFGPSDEQRARKFFPITAQLSAVPNGAAWVNVAEVDAKRALGEAIDEIIGHGFTGLEYPFHLGPALDQHVLEYVRPRDIFLTYNHTFEKGGVENFGRNAPPPISVCAPGYIDSVKKNLAPVLAEAASLPRLYNMFCYQDEPFHAGLQSFDFSADARREFRTRFGYEMPPNADAARTSPKQWLDLINFQSDIFPAGWRQVYKLIKSSLPEARVVLTHDSHSAMGAGVDSNSKVAVDDIFHWGADFADTFVFDIYPYMMFDYRYGEMGKLRKPRMSQLHFAFAQLRNVTRAYQKSMGFWFGTYNRRWFKDFMGPELEVETWAEVEVCYTAIGQGADFLISGYEVPEDSKHWTVLGKGLEIVQQAGPDLLRCPKVKAKACFLFPRTQYVQLQQEYWNVAVAYDLFRQSFGELDCLHEEQVKDANLDGYEVLVMFDIQLLPQTVAERIVQFVRAGGTVIADCVTSMDAYCRPMDTISELFGVANATNTRVRRSGVWVPSLTRPHWFVSPVAEDHEDVVTGEIITGNIFGSKYSFRAISPRACDVNTGEILLSGSENAPALIHKRSGKGQAFLFGFCMQDTYFATWETDDAASRTALVRLLGAIPASLGITPNISSSNPLIEACLRANQRDAYVVVINHEADSPQTSVRIARPEFDRIWNLTESRNLRLDRTKDRIEFEIEVPRDRPQLLRLLRES